MTDHPKKKRKKKILTKIHLTEISAVDVPAQEGALATIMKSRHKVAVTDPYADPEMKKKAALTSANQKHTHLVMLDDFFTGGEMNHGHTSWEDGHQHPWVRGEDGTITLGKVDGHTHKIATLSKHIPDDVAAPAASEGSPDAGSNTKKSIMTEEEILALQEESKLDKARADKAEKIADLNDAQSAVYKNLSGDEADTFLAKSNEDRQTEVDAELAKAADADPVVCEFEGRPVRKSQDPTGAITAMAKRLDDQDVELKKEREERQSAVFAKRAQDQLSHSVGEPETKIALVKAVATIKDADMRKAVDELLKAADGAFLALTKAKGHSGDLDLDASGADAKLQALGKKLAKEAGVSEFEGEELALDTEEGQALYAQSCEDAGV